MTANTPASRKAKGGGCSRRSGGTWSSTSVSTRATSCRRRWGRAVATSTSRRQARSVFSFGVECKAQERIALPEWWEQCTRNAAAEGLAPLLVLKQSRREPLAVLRWEDLLSLLRYDHRWQNLAEGLTGGRA